MTIESTDTQAVEVVIVFKVMKISFQEVNLFANCCK